MVFHSSELLGPRASRPQMSAKREQILLSYPLVFLNQALLKGQSLGFAHKPAFTWLFSENPNKKKNRSCSRFALICGRDARGPSNSLEYCGILSFDIRKL